ncbi:MAG: EAL domain-containing protein [Pseudomonadota bacterium]
MSLNKKLWLAIVYILILASGGSFTLSTIFSKHYLEEQLQFKNIDNATSLALSMSQLQKDSATIDLLISAQFDSGHYKYIGLLDPSGKLITERINTNSETKAPKWFTQIFPIKAEIGVAEVQDGWSQYGTLHVESNPNFAYDELWESTLLIALWSIAIGLISGYAGNQTVQKILRPLKDIVNQATAIGEHRFITIEEPKTEEFKAVVGAMNSLSNRIKNTVNEESARLNKLQYQTNFDHITELMNHQYFMSNIDANISREEYFNQGVLVVSRLTNLALIDQTLGYQKTNDFLKLIGSTLENACINQPSLIAGRLNGTDFAIFSKTPIDTYLLGNQIKALLEKLDITSHVELNANFVSAAAKVTKSDVAAKLIARLDNVLDGIKNNHENIVHILNQEETPNHLDVSRIEWEILLNSALNDNRIKLQRYPVVNQHGKLIHFESPVRLQLHKNGNWFCAGEFLAWATQLNLISRIDTLVVETATELLSIGAYPIGLNISAESICDPNFTQKMVKLIQSNLSIANLLYFEVPERGAFDYFAEFKVFCKTLKALGCKVGIEHVGSRISRLGELHDVGLDYIKIDVSIIREIDTNEANKTLLRGLCMIAHSIGVLAIAEGVQTNDEIEALKLIGIDGMTGPGINFS